MKLWALVLVAAAASASHAVGASGANRVHDRLAPLVRVPASYLAQCRLTARKVGYPVPCPTRLPAAMTQHQDGATVDCNITVICPAGNGPWKGWATGSLASATQHLVIAASPRSLSIYAKAVDGPGWSPTAHVQPLAWVTTSRWRMRAVYVSPVTNESAFAHHIALVWTVGTHTYAIGFHNFTRGCAQRSGSTSSSLHGLNSSPRRLKGHSRALAQVSGLCVQRLVDVDRHREL